MENTWRIIMKKLLVSVLALGFSATSFAAVYGEAGCGLGSMLLGDKKGMMQVLASTTNGLSGNQTFGISSGTSNCAGGGKTATQFIDVNKAALSNDVARGHGDTVAALSEIYGCKDAKAFQKTLKSNYPKIFSTQKSEDINANIKGVIKAGRLSWNA